MFSVRLDNFIVVDSWITSKYQRLRRLRTGVGYNVSFRKYCDFLLKVMIKLFTKYRFSVCYIQLKKITI